MTLYRVKAATTAGKVVQKQVEAASRVELERMLENEGLFPIEVRQNLLGSLLSARSAKVSASEFLVFNQGLASLLKSGLPVTDAFETLIRVSRNDYLADALADVTHEIRSGQSISDAMKKTHPELFPPLYTASISAGERTGDLIPSIRGYISYIKRTEAVRKKVVSASLYPIVLAVLTVIILGVLFLFAVPSFTRIYSESGAELPLATRMLLVATGALSQYLWVMAAAAVVTAVALKRYFQSERGRKVLDRMKLSLPKIGEIYFGYTTSKFTMTLAMVLNSGITLIEGLEMAMGVLDNTVLEDKLRDVIKDAREGGRVSDAMTRVGLMPELTLMMFGVGERSANLPEVLVDITDFYEQELDHKVGVLTNLIEPVLLIIMGLVVGTTVALLYLPMFMLGELV